jgi:hypothetical protein
MEQQKVIITKTEADINEWLERGWLVKSVTAGHVSTASGSHLEAKFLVVLHKPIEML